ncbi:MAG: PAS domain S-box protein [Candidatus Lokiarchaeota archaeon]|nr:PAS domain S-box protein [Candidatus Lokiarchaeota archaeon]
MGKFMALKQENNEKIKELEVKLKDLELKYLIKSKELDILHDITSFANEMNDLKEILDNLLSKLINMMNLKGCAIYLYDKGSNLMELKAIKGITGELIQNITVIHPKIKLLPDLKSKTEINILGNYYKIQPDAENSSISSTFLIPLLSKEEFLGLINLVPHELDKLSQNNIEMLVNIGNELGCVIKKFLESEKMQESEEKFKAITEDTSLGIIIIQDRIIKYASKGISNISEFSIEELTGLPILNFFNIIHPNERNEIKKIAIKKESGDLNAPNNISFRIFTKSGKIKWLDVHTKDIIYHSKNAILVVGIDQTEKKLTEEKLKESEEDYRKRTTILEYLNKMIIKGNSAKEVNVFFEEILELIKHLMDVKIVVTYIYEKGKKQLVLSKCIGLSEKIIPFIVNIGYNDSFLQTLMQGKKALYLDDYTIARPKFINFPLTSIIAVPIFDEGNFFGVLSVARDSSNKFSPDDLSVMLMISDILSSVISRLQYDSKLKKSEEKYRTLLETSPDHILITDLNGKIEYINRHPSDFELGTVIGKQIYEFISPEFHEDQKNVIMDVLETGCVKKVVLKGKEPLGYPAWYETQLVPLKKGEIIEKLMYIARDITDIKTSKLKILESEQKYKGIFDENITAIYVFDTEKKFMDSNQAGLDLLGYSLDELLSLSIPDVDGGTVFNEPAHATLLLGEKIENYIHNLQRKDGKMITVLNNSRPLTNENGEIIGMQSTIIDISDRIAAENTLKESEEKYRLISENINDLLAIINENNEFEFINEEIFQKYLEYNETDLLGKDIHNYINKGDLNKAGLSNLILDTIKSGDILLDTRFKHKKGFYLWLEMKIRKFTDKNGKNKALILATDISERRALEEARLEYLKDLEQEISSKSKELRTESKKLQDTLNELNITQELLMETEKLASVGLLAAGIAHEINNPLMGIINYADIVYEELEKTNSINLEIEPYSFIKEIMQQGNRISEIVNGLLSFSRQDQGVFIISDISEVIKSALLLVLPKIRRFQIDLSLDADNNIPKIPMRVQNIQQVIINVLQNSLDALNEKYGLKSKPNTKKISINIKKVFIKETEFVNVMITDNGIGIKKKNLPKVFDPFFTTKKFSKEHGVGLGLSISYGIIKAHKGEIDLKSKWGESTTVVILLPVKNENE